MTDEQIHNTLMNHTSEIAAIQEKVASAHKRINENDRITEGIHKLASNVEALALQVKLLTERMDENIGRIEAGLKGQGERIGALEKEPAAKWKNFTWLIFAGVVTAVVAFLIGKFL